MSKRRRGAPQRAKPKPVSDGARLLWKEWEPVVQVFAHLRDVLGEQERRVVSRMQELDGTTRPFNPATMRWE